MKSNRWNTRSYRTSIEVFNQSVGREVICVLTFNKGNKVWFQQTINADIEYSETLKHVVTDITPGVSSTQRTQCGDCVFPLVIRNVTKVLSNTVKQGYTREYRVPVYHKHPQLSYFSLERKNKEINCRLECLSEYSSSLFKIYEFSLTVKLLCNLLWIIYCTLITLINRIPIKSWIHYFNKRLTFCQ